MILILDFEFGFDSFLEPLRLLFDYFDQTSTARVYCNVPSGEDSLLWGSSLDVSHTLPVTFGYRFIGITALDS